MIIWPADHCGHCPARTGARCRGQDIKRLCDRADPSHPDYSAAVRRWLADGAPSEPTAAPPSPSAAMSRARALAMVAACPHGGPSRGALPVSMQRHGCNCGELYPCALGRGKVAGRVATADCVRCKVAELDAVDAARLDENPPRADS